PFGDRATYNPMKARRLNWLPWCLALAACGGGGGVTTGGGNGGGGGTSANPAPVVGAIASLTLGFQTASTVTIPGSGFIATSMVQVDGTPLLAMLVSPTEMQVNLPGYLYHAGSHTAGRGSGADDGKRGSGGAHAAWIEFQFHQRCDGQRDLDDRKRTLQSAAAFRRADADRHSCGRGRKCVAKRCQPRSWGRQFERAAISRPEPGAGIRRAVDHFDAARFR